MEGSFPELQTDSKGVVGDSASTNEFPSASGSSATGVSGTVQRTQPNQIFKIKSFGHTEATYNADPTTHPSHCEIWVDGKLFMSWQNFQWRLFHLKTNNGSLTSLLLYPNKLFSGLLINLMIAFQILLVHVFCRVE